MKPYGLSREGERGTRTHDQAYLGDPRTSGPEKLRTILRQPTEPELDATSD